MKNYNEVFKFGVNGWCDFQDIYDEAIRRYVGGKFVEIGCWMGQSSGYMLDQARKANNPITLYCIDTFQGDPHNPNEQRLLKEHGKSLKDTFLFNLSEIGFEENKDFHIYQGQSETMADFFKDGSLDFVFVDGGHQSEQVTADLNAWWPKVKIGGMMAGHDFNSNSVSSAVKEFFNDEVLAINSSNNSWFLHKTI